MHSSVVHSSSCPGGARRSLTNNDADTHQTFIDHGLLLSARIKDGTYPTVIVVLPRGARCRRD